MRPNWRHGSWGAAAWMLLAMAPAATTSAGSSQPAAASDPERLEFAMVEPPAAAQPPKAAAGEGAAPAENEGEALAKKLSNPIASLISIPFQFNYDGGYGPEGDGRRGFVNVQPVIPITLSPEWNLISRTIVPLVYQDDLFPGAGHQAGLGDIVQSFFFSPSKPGPGGIIWGVGPVFLLPSATDDLLGGHKWGAGPTGVILKQHGPWTVGMLANHIWSYAGDSDYSAVNATFLQPFVSYTTRDAWTFNLNTETTYDWTANEWSVPINFNISKLLRFGKLPVQIGGGVRYWAASPDQGPEGWGARVTMTFLLPK